MKDISICIIGLGPWGLCTLERIFSRVRRLRRTDIKFHIHIVEPSELGPGVHAKNLPDHLLLNTKCGHVSMFVEDQFADISNPAKGPTLLEWAILEGYRLAEDGFTLVKVGGREITEDDFLPRRLLGDYLNWFCAELLKNKPPSVACVVHRQRAIDISPVGPGETITLADNTKFFAHYVVLTTGHTPNVAEAAHPLFAGANTSDRLIPVAYPIEEHLARIQAGQAVGICGFGLVAIDILATLTLGRGGKFIRDASSVKKYIRSGKEPRIFMFSRSGLPYFARPATSKPLTFPRYVPAFFTPALVSDLRRRSLSAGTQGKLDFVNDLLPALWDEMQLVYYQTQARSANGKAEEKKVGDVLRRAWFDGSYKQHIDQFAKRYGAFEPREIFFMDLRGELTDSADYQKKFLDIVKEDLSESANGETGSARKAAFELFRELRDTIRSAVDFGGLTAASHRQFTQTIAPLISRAIVGPPRNRAEEVMALLESGVAQAPFGPTPSLSMEASTGKIAVESRHLKIPFSLPLDWVCLAFLDQPTLSRTSSPLLKNLFEQGRLQDFSHGGTSGSVQLDRNLHPLNAAGDSESKLWVLGPLTEGIKYFNNYIPSPKSRIKAFQEADQCIVEILKREDLCGHKSSSTMDAVQSGSAVNY